MRFLSVLLSIAILSGCGGEPRDYPVPPQFIAEDQAPRVRFVVGMRDSDAPSHFVSDIYDDQVGDNWRWVGQHPALKFFITDTERLKFLADFTFWDTAMQQTGPVVLKFLVNGKMLGTEGYDKPGRYHFEKAVPADWLSTATDTVLGAEIDKMYVDPQDGRKYGFILIQIGLIPE